MSSFPEFQSWLIVEVAAAFGAAALAGKLFADLGCTVARLEAADAPATPATDSDAELFELLSRSKHSVSLAGTPEATGPLEALLGSADILVADREGLLRLRTALRTTDLRDRFPRLTVCACTLFGMEGPMAAWTGGEEIVQAVTGIMSITSHPDGGPMLIAGAPLTGAAAMYAVMSALADVMRKSDGEKAGALDVTVYDAALSFHSSSFPVYFLTGEYDFATSPDMTRELAAQIKGAKFTEMKDNGHFPMSENPVKFLEYLKPILNEIAGR